MPTDLPERNGPRLRSCAGCHSPFSPSRLIYCQLCRQWFCVECHKEHVFFCPKNPEEPRDD